MENKKEEKFTLKALNQQKFEFELSLRKKKMFTEMMQKRLNTSSKLLSVVDNSEVNPFHINSNVKDTSVDFFKTIIDDYYIKIEKDEDKISFLKEKLQNINSRNDILSALNIIETKILHFSPNNKLKRMIHTEKLIDTIINYAMFTNDYYLMLLSTKIIVRYAKDYDSVRDLLFNDNVFREFSNQIVNKFAQSSFVLENIYIILNYVFTKKETSFKEIDVTILDTIVHNLCNIINSEHFNSTSSMRFALLWNLCLILQEHYNDINERHIERILNTIIMYPLNFSQEENRDTFSIYCEIMTMLSYDNCIIEKNNYFFIDAFINKIFPFIFEYVSNSNPNLIHLTTREVLCALLILNNIIKFTIDQHINVKYDNILSLVGHLITLYRLQIKVSDEIPIQIVKCLSLLSSLSDESISKMFTVEMFKKIFIYYTKSEESISSVINMIENVMKYQNENVVSILLSQTNFLNVVFKGLSTVKSEVKITTLTFICFIYEYFASRKINYIDINEEFRKFFIFDKIERLYQEDNNKYISQQAKELIEYIEKNNYNNFINDVIKS